VVAELSRTKCKALEFNADALLTNLKDGLNELLGVTLSSIWTSINSSKEVYVSRTIDLQFYTGNIWRHLACIKNAGDAG